MKKYIYLLAIGIISFSCNTNDVEETTTNPCDNNAQGVSITTTNDNYLISDQAITVQYVTGNPQGNYYHIFNTSGSTITNFYTFAVNSGDTSTLDQNWNTTAGSFLSIDNNPVYGTQQNPINLTNVQGGTQVGDNFD